MPTANAEGWVGSEGGVGRVSARRVFGHPSDRRGASAFAGGMLGDIQKKTRSAEEETARRAMEKARRAVERARATDEASTEWRERGEGRGGDEAEARGSDGDGMASAEGEGPSVSAEVQDLEQAHAEALTTHEELKTTTASLKQATY